MNIFVWMLAICQALLTTGNILLVAVTGLIGQQLAPSAGWVTFPVAMQFMGLMLATIPASLIMGVTGRKKGFVLGNLVGISGAVLAVYALQQQQFMLFSCATLLLGIGIGFGMLYRFAAVELCSEGQQPRAISAIMAGGVIAAIIGPSLAVYSQAWWPKQPFIGAFVGLLGLYIIALILLLMIRFNDEAASNQHSVAARPLRDIIGSANYIVAVVAGVVSYFVMNLLMTATPLAMHHHGYHFAQSASVIEWHVLGMFAPSFITGRLILRIGLFPTMLLGLGLMVACVLVNLLGTSFNHFAIALTLLGVGWNFMFIGATQMLTQCYQLNEKAKAQAVNEFVVFSLVAVSALSAGWLEQSFGWRAVNYSALPILLVGLLCLVFYQRQHKGQ
ncbi:MFS transporter [Agarivorans sp. Toyoura001]|uniref:MFS transporter n=1 Tax=Agarivorans sp. Toyoura001 TaxID=2283141 RepID=UPI0010D42A6B|nr:MFS transporter [Agarivorans sp. Toyoura001]GDY25657.1 MFS transporter [Agarivorans sp. Toyoura001]